MSNANQYSSAKRESTIVKGTTGYPTIVITVSEDKLKAYVSLMNREKSTQNIDEEMLFAELEKQSIVVGIKEDAVKGLAEKWNKDKKNLENILVAEGVGVVGDGVDFKSSLSVRGIMDSETLEKAKALERHHFFYLEELSTADRVDQGTVLLEVHFDDTEEKGTNVYGESVSSSLLALQKLEKGKGVGANGSEQLIALYSGVLAFVNDKIEVLPFEFDGKMYAEVDDDFMKVEAEFLPHHFSGKPLTEEKVLAQIKEMGVKSGIQNDLIQECISRSVERSEIVKATICEGRSAVHGKDGYIEYLIDFAASLKPKINEGGHADFKNLSLIKPVQPGQELARYHPAKKGLEGINLKGENIPARDGHDIEMPKGENTQLAEGDENLLLASVSGNARLSGQLVEVSECYVVDGDVDFSTGHIKHPKTVVVNHDVKATFNMEIGGDLEVNGIVEDCQLNVKGNALLKAGFLGTGEGLVESDGEVSIGFVRNQTVKCRKNLFIGGEAINCKLYSRRNIEVGGKTLGIVGGSAHARNEIICESAGNESGTKTELTVGVDFALVEEKIKTDVKMKELLTSKSKLDPHLEKLIRLKSLKKSLTQKEALLLKQLVEMQSKIKSQLKVLEERKELVVSKLKDIGNAKVIIKKAAYPGVTISIGNVNMQIKRKREGSHTYLLKNGEIVGL